MSRLFLPIVLLSGCYEFEGDRGVLGFVSNLVDPSHPDGWSPEVPIAAGTDATFLPVKRLGLSDEEEEALGPIQVTGSARGLDERWTDGPELTVTGSHGQDGVVRYRGELRDHFSVAFTEVEELVVGEPLVMLADSMVKPDELWMLEGASIDLVAAAYGADGAVGFAVSDLLVEGAEPTESGLRVLADHDRVVRLELMGAVRELPVHVLQPEDLVATLRIEHPIELGDDTLTLVREVGLARDGALVLLPDSPAVIEQAP